MGVIVISVARGEHGQQTESWKKQVQILEKWWPEQLTVVDRGDCFQVSFGSKAPPEFDAIDELFKLLTSNGFEQSGISPVWKSDLSYNDIKYRYSEYKNDAQCGKARKSTNTLLSFQPSQNDVPKSINLQHLSLNLHKATIRGDYIAVQQLLNRGANIDSKSRLNETALLMAAKKGDDRIAELLLTRGATLDVQDYSGKSALAIAAENGHENIVVRLIKSGAIAEGTILQKLIETGASTTTVKACFDAGASITITDELGRTALHVAVQKRNKAMIAVLLEMKGVDITAAGEGDRTVVHMAASDRQDEILEALLESRGEMCLASKDRHGQTPLHLAAQNDREQIVECLLGRGADSSVKDNDGRTPAMEALRFSNLQVAEILKDHSIWYARFKAKMEMEVCCVCIEPLLPGHVTGLKCGHIYHHNCLQGWYKNKNSCAICRKEIEIVDLQTLFSH